MKLGDIVEMSTKNPNHLDYGICAHAGMKGEVKDIWEDGSFSIFTGNSWLIVPMNNGFNEPIKGVWILLNGEHIFHKRIKIKSEENNENFIKKFIRNFLILFTCKR